MTAATCAKCDQPKAGTSGYCEKHRREYMRTYMKTYKSSGRQSDTVRKHNLAVQEELVRRRRELDPPEETIDYRQYIRTRIDWAAFYQARELQQQLMRAANFTTIQIRKLRRERLSSQQQPACLSWPVTDADIHAMQGIQYLTAPTRLVAMVAWQSLRCAICELPLGAIDHEHKSKLVRGLLCENCNATEGRTIYFSHLVQQYRICNPATMLDLQIKYSIQLNPALREFLKEHEKRILA